MKQSEQCTTNQVFDEVEPSAGAMAGVEPMVDAIWGANGNPKTVTIDRYQLKRIMAFGVEAAIKACDRKWR